MEFKKRLVYKHFERTHRFCTLFTIWQWKNHFRLSWSNNTRNNHDYTNFEERYFLNLLLIIKKIWNFEGVCLRHLEGHTGSITCLHFDAKRIISGSLDFDIKFWRLDNGQCVNTLDWITKEGHTGAIRCLKADNQKIISCSDDKTIKIWNIETGERYVTLKNHSDGVTCLQFNDYYILSGSYDRTIKLWDFSVN